MKKTCHSEVAYPVRKWWELGMKSVSDMKDSPFHPSPNGRREKWLSVVSISILSAFWPPGSLRITRTCYTFSKV